MDKKNLSLSDVPQELIDEVTKQFEANGTVRRLRFEQQNATRNHDFVRALVLGRKIDALFKEAVFNVLKEADKADRVLFMSNLGLTSDDEESLMKLIMVLFMCSDFIESAVMNIDETLHKYDANVYFEAFDDIRQLSKLSKAKLARLRQLSNYLNNPAWGDGCDNMYNMLLNKAGALLRKLDKDDVK
ncbi:MAG: hypothetical protein K5854_09550 [Prevotella sp.]|nr:hypothetical protein [Prevotella sp.]